MSRNVGKELPFGADNTPEDGRLPLRRGESLKSRSQRGFFKNSFPLYSVYGAAQVSKTLAPIYQTIRFHTPEDSTGEYPFFGTLSRVGW